MADALVEIWRRLIVGDEKSWVLFENGTCVILMEPGEDLAAQATALMEEWGPVWVGSAAGDFSVISPDNAPGWVVTCHHPDILTYVASDDVGPEPTEVAVGLTGRGKRDADGLEPRVIHVEDRRGTERSPA